RGRRGLPPGPGGAIPRSRPPTTVSRWGPGKKDVSREGVPRELSQKPGGGGKPPGSGPPVKARERRAGLLSLSRAISSAASTATEANPLEAESLAPNFTKVEIKAVGMGAVNEDGQPATVGYDLALAHV